MKAKPVVMLLFAAALVGGFFVFSRRANAATGDPGASDQSFLDSLLESFGLGGATAGGAAGAQGTVPFSEVTTTPTFPGGGTTPLAFGAGAGSVPGGGPGSKPGKGTASPIPTQPTRLPIAFEGGAGGVNVRDLLAGALGGGKKPTPTLAPGRSTPVAPKIPKAKPAPKAPPVRLSPIARALGATGRQAGGDRRVLALR